MGLYNVFNVAGSSMSAQSVRLNTVASNLANADTVSTSENNTIEEMTNMMAASRSYQNSVEVFNTSKQLLLKTLSMGR